MKVENIDFNNRTQIYSNMNRIFRIKMFVKLNNFYVNTFFISCTIFMVDG